MVSSGSFNPNSPATLPRVQLPVTSVYSASKSVPNLNDVNIPSPLLYHKKSRDLFTLSEDNSEGGSLNGCPLNLSQRVDLSLSPAEGDCTIQPCPSTMACDQGAMQIQNGFRNIPQPPWILPSKEASPTSTPTEVNPCKTVDAKSDKALVDDGDLNLVFSTLSEANAAPTCKFSLIDETSFIEDHPQTIERMWVASEAGIGNPQEHNQHSSWQHSSWSFSPRANFSASTPQSSESTDLTTPKTVDIAVCSTPTCTALVPARLYHHQYLGWPQWQIRGYQDAVYSLVGARVPPGIPVNSFLPNWCVETGLESKHGETCTSAADWASAREAAGSAGDNFAVEEVGPESDNQEAAEHSLQTDDSVSDLDWTSESASEILWKEAMWSDDEWAGFDWDKDLTSEVDGAA